MGMLIYKIMTHDQWQTLRSNGSFEGAPVDLRDGFIHFSTAEQLRETAEKHFAGQDGLTIAAVDADKVADALKWETSRGGALFPHLYDRLSLESVVGAWDFPLDYSGRHTLPPEIRE